MMLTYRKGNRKKDNFEDLNEQSPEMARNDESRIFPGDDREPFDKNISMNRNEFTTGGWPKMKMQNLRQSIIMNFSLLR